MTTQPIPQPPVGTTVPSVTVNAAGLLELPYSPAWSEALMASLQEQNNQLIGLQGEQDAANIKYTEDRQATDSEFAAEKGNALNNTSSRGLAFSSAYSSGLSGAASQYLSKMNNLDRSHTSNLNNIEMQRTGTVENFRRQQQQDAVKYAEELASKAGTLGYGTQPQGVTPPKPAPTPVKPKPAAVKPKPKPKRKRRRRPTKRLVR